MHGSFKTQVIPADINGVRETPRGGRNGLNKEQLHIATLIGQYLSWNFEDLDTRAFVRAISDHYQNEDPNFSPDLFNDAAGGWWEVLADVTQ